MLLCWRHHTLVHEGAITVERDALSELTFVRPDGRVIEATPRLAVVGARPLPLKGAPGRFGAGTARGSTWVT